MAFTEWSEKAEMTMIAVILDYAECAYRKLAASLIPSVFPSTCPYFHSTFSSLQ